MKELYLGLKAQIQAAAPLIKYIGMWNNQVDDLEGKENKIYSFGFPCVFFEFANENVVDSIGAGVQVFDPLDIKVHIIDDFYDAQDGTIEVNLEIFDIEAQIYSALQLFQVKGTNYGSGPISRVSVERDYDHSNLYHSIPTYRTTWTDNSQSQPVGGFDVEPPLSLGATIIIQ